MQLAGKSLPVPHDYTLGISNSTSVQIAVQGITVHDTVTVPVTLSRCPGVYLSTYYITMQYTLQVTTPWPRTPDSSVTTYSMVTPVCPLQCNVFVELASDSTLRVYFFDMADAKYLQSVLSAVPYDAPSSKDLTLATASAADLLVMGGSGPPSFLQQVDNHLKQYLHLSFNCQGTPPKGPGIPLPPLPPFTPGPPSFNGHTSPALARGGCSRSARSTAAGKSASKAFMKTIATQEAEASGDTSSSMKNTHCAAPTQGVFLGSAYDEASKFALAWVQTKAATVHHTREMWDIDGGRHKHGYVWTHLQLGSMYFYDTTVTQLNALQLQSVFGSTLTAMLSFDVEYSVIFNWAHLYSRYALSPVLNVDVFDRANNDCTERDTRPQHCQPSTLNATVNVTVQYNMSGDNATNLMVKEVAVTANKVLNGANKASSSCRTGLFNSDCNQGEQDCMNVIVPALQNKWDAYNAALFALPT